MCQQQSRTALADGTFCDDGILLYLVCPLMVAASSVWLLSAWHVDSSNEERNFTLNIMNWILYLNHCTWPVPTVLSSAGLGTWNLSWSKTWMWNDMGPTHQHVADSLFFHIPCGRDRSVLQRALLRKQIWRVSGLQEHLVFTFTAWSVSPGAWGGASCSQERRGWGTGYLLSRAHGLPSSMAHISTGPRTAQEGSAGNTRLLWPTPSHQQQLPPPWPSFWARRCGKYGPGSQEQGVFCKI